MPPFCHAASFQRAVSDAYQRRAPGACSFGWVLWVSGMMNLQANDGPRRRAKVSTQERSSRGRGRRPPDVALHRL